MLVKVISVPLHQFPIKKTHKERWITGEVPMHIRRKYGVLAIYGFCFALVWVKGGVSNGSQVYVTAGVMKAMAAHQRAFAQDVCKGEL